jgi:hypothetical protein
MGSYAAEASRSATHNCGEGPKDSATSEAGHGGRDKVKQLLVAQRVTQRSHSYTFVPADRLDEFRGEAKVILKGFDLRANIDDCAGRLQNRRSKEKAQELGRDAVEYIAQVVEFDAFDRLKKVSPFSGMMTYLLWLL